MKVYLNLYLLLFLDLCFCTCCYIFPCCICSYWQVFCVANLLSLLLLFLLYLKSQRLPYHLHTFFICYTVICISYICNIHICCIYCCCCYIFWCSYCYYFPISCYFYVISVCKCCFVSPFDTVSSASLFAFILNDDIELSILFFISSDKATV